MATLLCPKIDSNTLSLVITGRAGIYVLLPACVATNGTKITSISASGLLIQDFSVLPPSMRLISISGSIFAASSTSTGTVIGIDSEGKVDWDGFFDYFTEIYQLGITGSLLYGSLPTEIPVGMNYFIVSQTKLSGSIPPTIFKNINAGFSFVAIGCQLTGSIPAGLFQLTGSGDTFSFQVTLSGNQLTGSIPPSLLAPLANKQFTAFSLSLASNQLSGALPNNFLPENLMAASGNLLFEWNYNHFNESFPDNFLSSLTSFNTLTVHISNSALTGSLPSRFLPSSWTTGGVGPSIYIDLSFNTISGAIPESFLAGGLTTNVTLASFVLDLTGNQLTDAIPSKLFYVSVTTKRESTSHMANEDAS